MGLEPVDVAFFFAASSINSVLRIKAPPPAHIHHKHFTEDKAEAATVGRPSPSPFNFSSDLRLYQKNRLDLMVDAIIQTARGVSSSFQKLISRKSSTSVSEANDGGLCDGGMSVLELVRRLTAAFVGDLRVQKEYHASKARQAGRIGVTLATLMAFAAMAVALYMSAVPSSRTVRHWGQFRDPHGQIYFNFTVGDERKFGNDTNQICFCRSTNINWPDYVAFFPITRSNTTSELLRGPNITDWTLFCQSTIFDPGTPEERETSVPYNACLLMIEGVVAGNISQTCLQSASLIGPALLNDTIASRVTGGLDQIWWNYRVLQSLSNDSKTEYDQITQLHSLWTTMVTKFNLIHMSSLQDFWDAANTSNVLRVVKGNQTALGMEVAWYKYANICNPPFCDVVKQNSLAYRIFLVVAELGGLSTLVLAFVRLLLWPAMRQLFGWKLLRSNEQLHPKFPSKITPFSIGDSQMINYPIPVSNAQVGQPHPHSSHTSST